MDDEVSRRVAEDVEIAKEVLRGLGTRRRAWRG
jgi:hypothetical protein